VTNLSVDEFASEVTNCLSVDEFDTEVTNCLSVDEFATEVTNCLSVDEFATEVTNCLSVDEFATEVNNCLSVDEFATEVTRIPSRQNSPLRCSASSMGGRAQPKTGGKVFPAKISVHSITHKNQRYRPNHGVRRRRPTKAFRGNYAHDITPVERSFHRISIYAPEIFFMLPVPFE
jgi:hypothetical protein